jgi:hypothetical protein
MPISPMECCPEKPEVWQLKAGHQRASDMIDRHNERKNAAFRNG